MEDVTEITIAIHPHSDGGYEYSVFAKDIETEYVEGPWDGGIHIGDDIKDALKSAFDMANTLIEEGIQED